MKEKLQYFYSRFIGAVAKGRKMTEAKVNEVGRGRVWTGADSDLLVKVPGLANIWVPPIRNRIDNARCTKCRPAPQNCPCPGWGGGQGTV